MHVILCGSRRQPWVSLLKHCPLGLELDNWLASDTQVSSCLSFPTASIQTHATTARLFMWVLGSNIVQALQDKHSTNKLALTVFKIFILGCIYRNVLHCDIFKHVYPMLPCSCLSHTVLLVGLLPTTK